MIFVLRLSWTCVTCVTCLNQLKLKATTAVFNSGVTDKTFPTIFPVALDLISIPTSVIRREFFCCVAT